MWQRISTQHLKNAADNQHALEQRFFEHRFHPEHDVMHHITEIETIANQLRDINAPVTESQIMTKIISTLPPSYRGFMSAWDSVPIADRNICSAPILGRTLFTSLVAITDPHNLPLATSFLSSIHVFLPSTIHVLLPSFTHASLPLSEERLL